MGIKLEPLFMAVGTTTIRLDVKPSFKPGDLDYTLQFIYPAQLDMDGKVIHPAEIKGVHMYSEDALKLSDMLRYHDGLKTLGDV